MKHAWIVPALAGLLVYAAAHGASAGGADAGRMLGRGALALPPALAAGLVGYASGRLATRSREPRLELGNLRAVLVLLLAAWALYAWSRTHALVALPIVLAGHLAGRRNPYASDALLVATSLSALGSNTLDEGVVAILPAVLVALALLAREAWDLAEWAAASAAPTPRRAVAAELFRAAAVVGTGLVVAFLVVFLRRPVQSAIGEARPSAEWIAGVAALAALALLVYWLMRPFRRAGRPKADAAGARPAERG